MYATWKTCCQEERLHRPKEKDKVALRGYPTVFRYAWWRNTVEVRLYRLDQEHQTFLSELKKAVVDYFGLELCVEFKMRHISTAPLGAVYDEKKDIYRIVEKP
jgi:hypothetical protein